MTDVDNYVRKLIDNFNSHAHVERDSAIAFANKSTTISTHTLTWSVTWGTGEQITGAPHFNSHAHVERDIRQFLGQKTTVNFNSHAHVERDICSSTTGNLLAISTHTLTWSVTVAGGGSNQGTTISTHTLTWSVTFGIFRQ